MISITTQQKQFELRLRFSLTGIERAWRKLSMLLSFTQIREIEKRKRETLDEAGFNHWWI